jgi:hypothetical protein
MGVIYRDNVILTITRGYKVDGIVLGEGHNTLKSQVNKQQNEIILRQNLHTN